MDLTYIVFMRAANLCKLTHVSKIEDDGSFVEFYQKVTAGHELFNNDSTEEEQEVIQASFNRDIICGYAHEPSGPSDLSTNDRLSRIESFLGTLDTIFQKVSQGQEKVQ